MTKRKNDIRLRGTFVVTVDVNPNDPTETGLMHAIESLICDELTGPRKDPSGPFGTVNVEQKGEWRVVRVPIEETK